MKDINTTIINPDSIEILRISKDGIWVNPDVPVDDAAKAVLEALEYQIKAQVIKAVAQEFADVFKLMTHCENEMRYAGWGKKEQDNFAKHDVYRQVRQYLQSHAYFKVDGREVARVKAEK